MKIEISNFVIEDAIIRVFVENKNKSIYRYKKDIKISSKIHRNREGLLIKEL